MNFISSSLLMFLICGSAVGRGSEIGGGSQTKGLEAEAAEIRLFFRERAVIDSNDDGQIDIWNFFYPNQVIKEKRRDTNHDGKPDVFEYFAPNYRLERRLRDTNFDGFVDKWEVLREMPPVLSIVKSDLNFDGRVDKIVEVVLENDRLEYRIQADRDFNGAFESHYVADQALAAAERSR